MNQYSFYFIALSILFIILPNLAAHTQSLELNNSHSVLEPPNEDAPKDTTGAGSRDGGYCVQDEVTEGTPGFNVLMPTQSQTRTQRPTFVLYIPQTVAKTLFFSLKDAEENYYYQTTISLPSTPGEFSFQLPADAPVLETNKEYIWSLSLMCQQEIDPNDPTFKGVIKRVE